MRGGEIEAKAQNVHDKLAEVVAADASGKPATPISNYQVTAQALDELQTAIDALSLVEQGPRAHKGMIGGANRQIETLTFQLDEHKDTLRRLLPQLKAAYPQFVEAMRTAMVIVDSAGRRRAAKPEPEPAKA